MVDAFKYLTPPFTLLTSFKGNLLAIRRAGYGIMKM